MREKSKKLLSLALALVICLALMPAVVLADDGNSDTNPQEHGTPLTIEDERYGVSITFDKYLRTETQTYYVGNFLANMDGMFNQEYTFYIVEDNSAIHIEALPGKTYGTEGYFSTGAISGPSENFSYACYPCDEDCSWWDDKTKYIEANYGLGSGGVMLLAGPVDEIATPREKVYFGGDNNSSYGRYSLYLCESDFNRLVPARGAPLTIEDEMYGVSITFSGYLRTETHTYRVTNFDTEWELERTFYVVEDNSPIQIQALPSREYGTGQGYDYTDEEIWEKYAWNHGHGLTWSVEEKAFLAGYSSDPNVLSGPITETASPHEGDFMLSDNREGKQYNCYLCESDFNRLVPIDQPVTPTPTPAPTPTPKPPVRPVEPDPVPPSTPILTPTATPEPTPEPEPTPASEIFSDVKKNSWYENAVTFVTNEWLFQGVSETSFAPAQPMSRAMLMTVLARADGQDTEGGATWYEKGMTWAAENGISDGSDPHGNITREQLVTMLYRYAGSPQSSGDLDAFGDRDKVSSWAKAAMEWAVSQGLIQGKAGVGLDPKRGATRAEVATILQRFLTKEK